MKPTALDIKSQGSLEGQQVVMGIDPGATAHLMSVLTNLYSNPAKAVLREYSTNAYDSHIEAGVDRPIEVFLPTAMSPHLRIKDYGVGMSVEDISRIYSQYGASTKRGEDTQVGMLGLGCKSALTYTNQFNLVAVKNGIKTMVAVTLTDNGTGAMEIVDTSATDDPNGVEVIIPVKNRYEMIDTAKSFFRFWKPGTVLVDGQQPEFLRGEKITEDIRIVDGLGRDYIVMGNVAYPVNNFVGNHVFGVVVEVPIGAVNFTPSREQLHYTEHTNRTVSKYREEFDAAIDKKATDDIDSATSFKEAWEKYKRWNFRYRMTNVTYKGHSFPSYIGLKGVGRNGEAYGYTIGSRNDYYSQKWFGSIALDDADYVLIVVSDSVVGTSAQKTRIKKYVEQNSLRHSKVRIVTEAPDSPWMEMFHVITWDKIKEETKEARVKTPTLSGYDILTQDKWGNWRAQRGTLDPKEPILYLSPTDRYPRLKNLAAWYPDAQIVMIARNRFAKFQRDFPNAEYLPQKVRREYEEAWNALTDTDKFCAGLSASVKEFLYHLDPEEIVDPEVKRLINIARGKIDQDRLALEEKLRARCLAVGKRVNEFEPVKTDLYKKYPLLKHVPNGYMLESVYRYINLEYRHK